MLLELEFNFIMLNTIALKFGPSPPSFAQPIGNAE